MSKNNSVVPQARAALDQFKMEAAREVGVQSPLKENIQHITNSENKINIMFPKATFDLQRWLLMFIDLTLEQIGNKLYNNCIFIKSLIQR